VLLAELRARQGNLVPGAAIVPVQFGVCRKRSIVESAFVWFLGVNEVLAFPEVGWSPVVLV